MAEIKNKIYMLAKQFCKKFPEDRPDVVVYGCLRLASMNETFLTCLLSGENIDNIEEIVKESHELKSHIEEEGLDPDLLLRGLQMVIPKLDYSSEYYIDLVKEYNEDVRIDEIVCDAIRFMPDEERALFVTGASIDDIMGFKAPDELASKEPEEETDSNSFEKPVKDQAKERYERKIYSDALNAYLKEITDIIPTFREMGDTRFLWSQSLLISVDDGFGLSTFLKKLASVYFDAELSNAKEPERLIREFSLDNPDDKESKGKIWGQFEERLDDLIRPGEADKIQAIVSCDISKWLAELDTPKVKEHLRRINEMRSSILLIFRIPYMEYRIVSDVAAILEDIMGIRTVSVPPLQMEQMVDYMINRAQREGYTYDDDCKNVLERGIIAEKNDGHFYGFRTLNKMMESIIYEKLKFNHYNSLRDKYITSKQLGGFLELAEREPGYAELLSQMVGVDDIIKEIDVRIKQIKVAQDMANKGADVERPSIHMLFKGSPGTGKTTIARIVARKLKDAGILSKGNLYEIKGRDLCGRYIGETTPKTCAYCRDAYGSVLFIDEAYELYRGKESSEKDYGKEALAALVAEMENHRDDMCVILAGYSEEMEEMIKGNSGLESRIPIVIEFPNYSRNQLEQIFFKMLEKSFVYEPEVKDAVHEYFEGIPEDMLNSKEFSNARFVRNLFEGVWGEAAMRYNLGAKDEIVIKVNDFKTVSEKAEFKQKEIKKHRPIGFVTG